MPALSNPKSKPPMPANSEPNVIVMPVNTGLPITGPVTESGNTGSSNERIAERVVERVTVDIEQTVTGTVSPRIHRWALCCKMRAQIRGGYGQKSEKHQEFKGDHN